MSRIAFWAWFFCAFAVVASAPTTGCGSNESPSGEPRSEARRTSAPATKPPAPPKRIFAKKFVAKIRETADRKAKSLGYLRAGAVITATTAEPVGRERCRGGWFTLPEGGFVCNVADVLAFDGEKLPERRAAQPDFAAPLPYPFGYAKRDRIPVFRRLPTLEELMRVEDPAELRALMSAPPSTDGGAGGAEGGGDPVSDGGVAPGDGGPPTLGNLLGHEESPVLRLLMKGFYVSLDREIDVGPRKVWRTQHNEFIPSEAISLVEGSAFEGTPLGGDVALPLGYVLSSDSSAYERPETGPPKRSAAPGYHHRFAVTGTEKIAGKDYVVAADGRLFSPREVVVIEAAARPKKVAETEAWIDIDLERQSLVAYEGDKPVYATLVSTGRVRKADVNSHPTPPGLYRILSKHVSHVMDGDSAIDGPYSIEDVPYVMYFQGAFALHSAFWHNRFGRPKSHGCVNLAPRDAKWLFGWTQPKLPAAWHGVYPRAERPGTWVRIRGETPAL